MVLLGSTVLLICLIPITSVEEAINTSFKVSPGTKYGPNEVDISYHTHVLGKCILEGEVFVQGEGIYFTADFYNTEHIKGIYVIGRYSFVIDPADDLYVFIFDNSRGNGESSVSFKLKETWTRPMAIGSPPLFIIGLIGAMLFLSGLVSLSITISRRTKVRLSKEMAIDSGLY